MRKRTIFLPSSSLYLSLVRTNNATEYLRTLFMSDRYLMKTVKFVAVNSHSKIMYCTYMCNSVYF